MNLSDIDLFGHLMPLVSVATGVLISLIVSHRRTEARSALDANRLRAALQVELEMLQTFYEDNLQLLEAGHEFLPSSRQMTSLYRANLGRIQLLNEAEIAPIVAAYGYNEVVESHLGATCRPLGQSYRVLAGETPLDAIGHRFRTGRAHIVAALEAMDQASGAPSAASPIRSRARSPVASPQVAAVDSPTLLAEPTVPA